MTNAATTNINIAYHTTPCGELLLGSYQQQLCICDWRYRRMRSAIDQRIQQGLQASYQLQPADATITQAIEQLTEYFAGQRTHFDVPLLLVGSAFQRSVWQALQQVAYGTTATYMQQAQRINNVAALRAVASANGANALSIIVPCHRIVGSNGSLVGYAGGLPAKAQLLALEQKNSSTTAAQQQLFG